MCADNTPAGLSVLAKSTTEVRQWYLQNGLQFNLDKSEAVVVGTTNQLCAVTSATTSVSSVSVAGVDLPVADDVKVLGSCSIGVCRFTGMSRQRHDRAITMHRPSDTLDTC